MASARLQRRGAGDDADRRVVVITGASSGIGRAVAHPLATAGARLVLCSRSAEALAAVVECRELGMAEGDVETSRRFD